MARPVRLQAGSRAPIAINPQIIIFVVFIGIIVYLVFGGGGGGKEQTSAGDLGGFSGSIPCVASAAAPLSARPVSPSRPPRSPGSAQTVASTPGVPPTPGSGGTVAATPVSGGTAPRSQRSSSPSRSRASSSDSLTDYGDPSKLKKLPTEERPGILKQARVERGGIGKNKLPMLTRTSGKDSGVAWYDTDEGRPLTRTHSTALMDGDYSETEGWQQSRDFPNYRPKRKKPKWFEAQSNVWRDYHGRHFTTKALLGHLVSSIEKDDSKETKQQKSRDNLLYAFLESVERIAKYDARWGGPSRPPDLVAMVGQSTRSNMGLNDKDLAYAMDPLGDDWDPAWGALPRPAIKAAEKISELITPEISLEVRKLIEKRMKLAETHKTKKDRKRRWGEFSARAQPRPITSNTLTPRRLCIGWFADHFRSTSSKSRMNISDDPDADIPLQDGTVQTIKTIKMTEVLGLTVANLLRWLEALGDWMRRYRLFTPSGVDLCGNGGRMAVTGFWRREESGDGTIINRYIWERTLTLFMWSDDKDIGSWLRRMAAVESAYDTGHWALERDLASLEGVKEVEEVKGDKLEKRMYKWQTEPESVRLIFRPGFNNAESTAALDNQWKAINRELALKKRLDRKPKVYRYNEPSKLWQGVAIPGWPGLALGILHRFKPDAVRVANIRQNHWASPDPVEQRGLNERHLLAILYALGPNLHSTKKQIKEDTVLDVKYHDWAASMALLDLTCFIPLVQRTGDPSKYDFVPLEEFKSLTNLAIPYTSHQSRQGKGDPSTLDLITSRNRGIYQTLVTRQVKDLHNNAHSFTLHVTFETTADLKQFIQEVQQYMIATGRDAARAGGANAGDAARKRIQRFADEVISKVHTVNGQGQQQQGENVLQGDNLLKRGGMISGLPLSRLVDVGKIIRGIR